MRGVRTRGGSNRTLVAPPASSSVWQQHERLQSQGAADEDARPESHPWLSELQAGPSTLLAEERVLTFLSASIGAGNLTNVARDWRQVLCAISAGRAVGRWQPSLLTRRTRAGSFRGTCTQLAWRWRCRRTCLQVMRVPSTRWQRSTGLAFTRNPRERLRQPEGQRPQ